MQKSSKKGSYFIVRIVTILRLKNHNGRDTFPCKT